MGVFRACINFQVLEDSIAESRFGEHAANGLLDNELGLLRKVVRGGCETLSAGIPCVSYIDLVGQFVARELHLVRIDYDDIVAAIGVGGVAGLVLAAQDFSDLRAEASQHLVGGVDKDPFLFDCCRIRRDGFVA